MNTQTSDPNRGRHIGPASLLLSGNPLDFIHEDYQRGRAVCAMLERIAATDDPDPDEAKQVGVFLRDELPLHLEDEEQDLFPLLRRRCEPEDEIGKAIKRLTADHRHAGKDTQSVIAILDALATGKGCLSDGSRAMLARYAGRAQRYLTLENAIILPFARLRLTGANLEMLRLRMKQRRGFAPLMEIPDAE